MNKFLQDLTTLIKTAFLNAGFDEDVVVSDCAIAELGDFQCQTALALAKKYRMFIEELKSKIHRVTVMEANLDYIGSITIDEDLMDAVNLIENERVDIYNITNGERFSTYAIKGKRGSGIIGINGAAAHKAGVGDLIIIASYASMDFEEAKTFTPSVIFPKDNKLQ